MTVSVSNKNMYVQFIDDIGAITLAAASTLDEGAPAGNASLATAKLLGERAAKAALEKGIKLVVLDRSGFKYHGRIKALADAVREAGIQF